MKFVDKFFLLAAAHALADFPLQGDFLANGKNHTTDLGKIWWKICLPAHALIHGGAVALITKSTSFGIVETIIHSMTDYAKCDGKLTIEQDQAIHLACKAIYALFSDA